LKNLRTLALALVLALASSLALVFAAPKNLAAQAPQNNQTDSNLTMATAPEDPPETARFKAALRLLAGFHQVLAVSQACARQDVWENYQNRNGRTFSQIFGSLKAGGAFDQKYRNLVEDRVHATTKDVLKLGCAATMRDIENGGWDLYKSTRFKADYKLFIGR
jgi:hypothetical protein